MESILVSFRERRAKKEKKYCNIHSELLFLTFLIKSISHLEWLVTYPIRSFLRLGDLFSNLCQPLNVYPKPTCVPQP